MYWIPSFRLARGLAHESSLPNGIQSASMTKLLLLGLPFGAPRALFGANSAGFALTQGVLPAEVEAVGLLVEIRHVQTGLVQVVARRRGRP